MIAGYACRPCFSPDQSYLCSGDGEGKMFIWDWKNGRLYSRFRAHDQVVIDCKWLPHETSKEHFNIIYKNHRLAPVNDQKRECPNKRPFDK